MERVGMELGQLPKENQSRLLLGKKSLKIFKYGNSFDSYVSSYSFFLSFFLFFKTFFSVAAAFSFLCKSFFDIGGMSEQSVPFLSFIMRKLRHGPEK